MEPGTRVMLSESAPEDLVMMVGSEAVLTVLCQMGGTFEGGRFYRSYLCRHEHRGRLTFDHTPGGAIDERHLKVIGEEESVGQRMLYNAQAEEAGRALSGLLDELP